MSTATAEVKHATIRRPPSFTIWVGFLAVVMAVGLVSGVIILARGLVVTGLTDQVPWGLWIALDTSAIGLGAGAFILSALVYILRVERLRPVARAAVLVGFIGYSSAMMALFLDIGRPERFYFPVIFWNVHSVLWEISMAVVLYFTVLCVEMAPTLFESRLLRWWPAAPKVGHLLHRATPILAVAGLAISLLHQSSLGATYGIITARPLWYNPSMSVLFILSAAAGGMAATLLGTLVASRLHGRPVVEPEVVRDIAVIAGAAMLGYLYLKLWVWASANYYSQIPGAAVGLQLLLETTPYGQAFWLIEVLLGGIVPAVIFLWPRLRQNQWMLMLACALAMLGAVTLRWDVTVSGLVVPNDWSPGVAFLFPRYTYQPTLPEIGAFVGIIAYMLMAFTLAVHFLPIYPRAEEEHHS